MKACAEHRLDSVSLKIQDGFAVTVILASEGYPGKYEKGKNISFGKVPASEFKLLEPSAKLTGKPDVVVFHAGTKQSKEDIITAGGRVLAVSAYATTLNEALEAVYAGVEEVTFEGKTFRRDIAHRYAFLPTYPDYFLPTK
jgi:phosphoribosylamine--glycine ligase / phosphoribosylformylglycinamidine cyclo-ligase